MFNTTGTGYLSRTRPVVDTAPDGAWRLTLLVFDRLGPREAEPWRVRWVGDAARAWHAQHQHLLEPGAVLRVHLERARAYQGQGGAPEIHARVISIEIEPKRPPAVREQLSNQEQPASVAA
ncbi:MAG TPA: hypothetical protein DET46_06575 [Comamonadaceae bacterium]|nr:MAG: hypothetical protein A3F76_07625 [Burkholderiales bacterium RIFCSPLOWO2_12_FULL_65_40]HCE28462.1 hypothetical protein [Comamonadaceae bacterium]